jgi:hypothetical protein
VLLPKVLFHTLNTTQTLEWESPKLACIKMLPQPVATADTYSPWDHESAIWSICWWTAAGPLQNSRRILDLSSAGWWFQQFHESCYPGSTSQHNRIRTQERWPSKNSCATISYLLCIREGNFK